MRYVTLPNFGPEILNVLDVYMGERELCLFCLCMRQHYIKQHHVSGK